MNEAHAQTAEIVDAGTKAFESYSAVAGPVAATWALVAVLMATAIVLLYRRLEKRDQEIAELKVKCAQEIVQAKLIAEREAEERVKLAWLRITEIYNSVTLLFGKCDQSNQLVATTLKNLQITLATKGIVTSD